MSRTRLIAAIAGCLLFLVLGWKLFNAGDAELLSLRRHDSSAFVHALGLTTMVMVGAFLPWLFGKLFDPSPGLQFLDEGMVENTNMFSVGFIAWDDITGLQGREVRNQKLLYVLLRDPQKYISRCGLIKRTVLRMCLRLGPSPVAITCTLLPMSFENVRSLVESNLARRRNA